MLIRTYKPVKPLSLFVDYFWYMENSNLVYSSELSLPSGSIDIVVDLREDKVSMVDASKRELTLDSTLMCGPHSKYFVINSTNESTVMGIHFKPGGTFPFIGVSLDQLHDTLLSMDTIWGNRAKGLRDELLEAPLIDRKFAIMEKRLMEWAVKPLSSHPAVRYALQAFEAETQSVDVCSVVERIGMSHRRFIEIFKRETGYTPKRYSRIRRFQAVLQRVHTEPVVDWMNIAISCGYYDQAHFIKDFQAFSGLIPSEYSTLSGRHPNHVPASL